MSTVTPISTVAVHSAPRVSLLLRSQRCCPSPSCLEVFRPGCRTYLIRGAAGCAAKCRCWRRRLPRAPRRGRSRSRPRRASRSSFRGWSGGRCSCRRRTAESMQSRRCRTACAEPTPATSRGRRRFASRSRSLFQGASTRGRSRRAPALPSTSLARCTVTRRSRSKSRATASFSAASCTSTGPTSRSRWISPGPTRWPRSPTRASAPARVRALQRSRRWQRRPCTLRARGTRWKCVRGPLCASPQTRRGLSRSRSCGWAMAPAPRARWRSRPWAGPRRAGPAACARLCSLGRAARRALQPRGLGASPGCATLRGAKPRHRWTWRSILGRSSSCRVR